MRQRAKPDNGAGAARSKAKHIQKSGAQQAGGVLVVMMKRRTNGRIPAKLPQGTVAVHKTGPIDHPANDCGTVYTDRGNCALALFCNGSMASEKEYAGTIWSSVGSRLLSRLSADICAEYMKDCGTITDENRRH